MKKIMAILAMLAMSAMASLVFCSAAFAADNDIPLNQLSLSGGMIFNVKSSFSGTPGLTLRPADLSDPKSFRQYDDGHVVWDGSTDTGIVSQGAKITGGWSYDHSNQKHGSVVDMHQTAWPGTASSSDDTIGPSAEILYRRAIGTIWDHIWGLEAGVGLASFNSDVCQGGAGTAQQMTDSYESFCPWLPGWTQLKAPFNGVAGQDPLIMIGSILPPTRVSQRVVVNTSTQDSLNAIVVPVRVGPFVNFPFCSNRLDISISGGFAAAEAFTDYDWSVRQTAGNASRSLAGSHDQSDLLLGAYAAVQANYNLGKGWSANAGIQYTRLDSIENRAGLKTDTLDLTNPFRAFIGIGKTF